VGRTLDYTSFQGFLNLQTHRYAILKMGYSQLQSTPRRPVEDR